MAESVNPISPKTVWAGIGALAGPLLLTIGQAFVDIVNSGSAVLPEPWQTIITVAASIIGAVVGAYAKKDGLRLPTIDAEDLQALPNAEVKLTQAAEQLNGPVVDTLP